MFTEHNYAYFFGIIFYSDYDLRPENIHLLFAQISKMIWARQCGFLLIFCMQEIRSLLKRL